MIILNLLTVISLLVTAMVIGRLHLIYNFSRFLAGDNYMLSGVSPQWQFKYADCYKPSCDSHDYRQTTSQSLTIFPAFSLETAAMCCWACPLRMSKQRVIRSSSPVPKWPWWCFPTLQSQDMQLTEKEKLQISFLEMFALHLSFGNGKFQIKLCFLQNTPKWYLCFPEICE